MNQPPASIAVERALLGSILLDNSLLDEACERVSVKDFYSNAHKRIFSTVCAMAAAGGMVDSVTLCEKLNSAGRLDEVGGAAYVSELIFGEPIVSSVASYCEAIKDSAIRRNLIALCRDATHRCQQGEESIQDILDACERVIFSICQKATGSGFKEIDELLTGLHTEIAAAQERPGELRGLSSGFPSLDRITGGWKAGEMIVVAARPGMGKTSLVLDFARHAALKAGKDVGIFSCEMSAGQIIRRLVCQEGRIDGFKMDMGQLDEAQWRRVSRSMGAIGSSGRFHIDDSPNLTPYQMRSRARRLKAKHGLELVIIDYLQLLSSDSSRKESRVQEITAISRAVKVMAGELEVPVIAVSQLNRQSELRRHQQKPRLSDLRESGAIEQDADLVLMVYRPIVASDKANEDCVLTSAEIIIRKNRNGPLGTCSLDFTPNWTGFEEPC